MRTIIIQFEIVLNQVFYFFMKHCKIVTCHVLMCKPSFQFQIPTTIKTREQFYIDPNRNNHSNINIAFSYRILYRPHWMCIYMLHVSDICQDEICFYFLDFKMPTVTMEITKCMQLMTLVFSDGFHYHGSCKLWMTLLRVMAILVILLTVSRT